MNIPIPVEHGLILSAFLFSVGITIILTKRNAIMMLLGIELLLNAANLNFILFNATFIEDSQGQLFTLFVMVIAVCETAVGLAIILQIYRHYKSSDPNSINTLKG